eukprot:m.55304 g.55304  ORF g.55304 m.55304 type:complete len:584 (+) comp13303_c0_seq1:398-2149(+)
MFVPVNKFHEAYNRIKQEALQGTVLVFVAPDADAVCAASLLTSLLRNDFVTYKLLPIASIEDVTRLRGTFQAEQVRSVVLINAGGAWDLLTDFEAEDGQPNANITFYVIDSHRPLNLANVFDSSRVIIFDDGQTEESIPAFDELFPGSDSEEEESNDENDDGTDTPSKRSRSDAAERRREREERQLEYYSSTFFGISAATLMWHLASDLGRGNNELLWLGIVGLTEQLLYDRIDVNTYLEQATEYRQDVLRLNSTEAEGIQPLATTTNISFEEEFRFMLMRHWNLYDAMYHSRFIATRFGIWRQAGKRMLDSLLAEMGVPLKVSKQKYTEMDLESREKLGEQLARCGPSFGLENVTFSSFVLKRGYGTRVSAADAVYALNALLESSVDGSESGWLTGFHRALDSLSFRGSYFNTLKEGMQLSMVQETAILSAVESIVSGKNIRKTQLCRFSILRDSPHQKFFVHPGTLRKLGLFLLDTFRFAKDDALDKKSSLRKKTMPIVVAAHNAQNETYLVMGIWALPGKTEGSVERNQFGSLFQQAGERIDARIRLSSFDSSVMEIKADDMNRFIGALTRLSSMRTGRV